MEGTEESSRPSLSFPLGLVLLIVVLVSITGLFSCCYNWNKLRNFLLRPSPPPDTGDNQSDDSLSHSVTGKDLKKPVQLHDQSLTVVMPGEEAPKYLAFPAPRTNIDV